MKNYNNVPLKYFINERYFLYDKSNLIKETYYCTKEKNINNSSVSYFNKKKKENEVFKIISPENLLEFFVNKNTNKDILGFRVASVSGKLPALKDKKIHKLSLTRLARIEKTTNARTN